MTEYCVIGSTFIDINTRVIGEGYDISFETTSNIGGKGFNIAKGLCIFNKKVIFHTYLANDVFGREVIQNLKELNCQITSESLVEGSTPISSNINDEKGNILFDKVDTTAFKNFPEVTIPETITDIVLFSHNSNQHFESAKNHKQTYKSKIFLSIAGSKDIPNVIEHLGVADVLFANRKETNTLLLETGFNNVEELMNHYKISEIVSTQDKDGVILYFTDGTGIIQKVSFSNYAGYPEPIINTVGAGDALVSTYIANRESLDPKNSIQKALQVTAFHIRNKFSSLQILPTDL